MFKVDESKIIDFSKDELKVAISHFGADDSDFEYIDNLGKVCEDIRRVLDSDLYKDDEFVNIVYQDEKLYIAKEMPDESRRNYANNVFGDGDDFDSVQKYRFLEWIGKVDVLGLRVKQASYVVDCKIARKELYDFPAMFYQLERVKKDILNLHMIDYNTKEIYKTYRMRRIMHCFDYDKIKRC